MLPWYTAAQKDQGTKTVCFHCSECNTAEAKVTIIAYLTPCFNDCGPYGQCSLLRRHGYLYAGCSCKAGECIFLGDLAILPKGRPHFSMLLFRQEGRGSATAVMNILESQHLPKVQSIPTVPSLGSILIPLRSSGKHRAPQGKW